MDAFFNWLSANPIATNTVILSFGLIISALTLTFLVAFFQGREISFWPPNIGSQPNKSADVPKKRNSETASTLSQKGASAQAFFVDCIPNLENRLQEAKSIAINGITLSRTSDTLWNVFKARAEKGYPVRILIVDPNHAALDLSATRFRKHQDPIRLKREVEHALDNFEPLTQQFGGNDKFQLRLMPISPAYGIWLIDAGSPTEEIWVELYSFRDLPEPTFHLLPDKDGEWFGFFKQQFELMWAASAPWLPKN